jgi:hypothetical protein
MVITLPVVLVKNSEPNRVRVAAGALVQDETGRAARAFDAIGVVSG